MIAFVLLFNAASLPFIVRSQAEEQKCCQFCGEVKK
jgi:hypothetical protein